MGHSNIAITTLLLLTVTAADPEPDPQLPTGLLHHSHTPKPQNLEAVITSIEEKLRILDTMYGMRFAPSRWEISIEASNRKLEALESKLAKIETVFELRVDKLTESLSTKSLKDELSKEQLARKIDVIYERLNHRMSFMESRIENNIAKFQNSVETTLTRTNAQLEHLEKTGNDVENDIIELGNAVEESKSFLQSLNTTLRGNGSDSADILDENQPIVNLTQRVLLACEEMSVRSKNVEEMTRKSLDLVNATRRELADGVKAVKTSTNRRISCPTVQDAGALDYLIEKVDTMGRKNEGNYQKLDTTIERLHMRQELYQESCHRLQLKEPQIENRIAEILEKILDSLENRTYTTDKNYENLLGNLKSHHLNVIRSVGYTTETVKKLGEQMTNDVKSMFANNPAIEKIDSIINSLQDLQDVFQELNATITTTKQLTPSQSQLLLNNTATILETIQYLNANMTTILDRLNDYYRNISDNFEQEVDVSSQILQIFNMTEADLARVNTGALLLENKEATVTDHDGQVILNTTATNRKHILSDKDVG